MFVFICAAIASSSINDLAQKQVVLCLIQKAKGQQALAATFQPPRAENSLLKVILSFHRGGL